MEFTYHEEVPILNYLNISLLQVVLNERYVLVLNRSQTPFPILDQYITDLFWPQTKEYPNNTYWQPSDPVVNVSSFNWTLSQSSLSFEMTPFASWQGIPIILTTFQSASLSNSLISIKGGKLTIESGFTFQAACRSLESSVLLNTGIIICHTLVVPMSTIEVAVSWMTDTIVPLTASGLFVINVTNFSPVFDDYISPIIVVISEGLNLSLVYDSFWSSNSKSVDVNVKDGDPISLRVSFDDFNISPVSVCLDKTNWNFNLVVDTSNYTSGNYSMKVSLWDKFNEATPAEITVILLLSEFAAPEFASDLPSSLEVQAWTQNRFELPQIINKDGDFSHIEIQPNK